MAVASAGKERWAEIRTSFLSRPPTLPSYLSPPLPSPSRRRGGDTTNYSCFLNKGREGGRCCQQLPGRLLRFLCKLFKRLVEKLASSEPRASSGAPQPLASPDPAGLGTERGGEGGPAEQPGRAGGRQRPAPGQMPLQSKQQGCSPQVAERPPPRATSGNPSQFRGLKPRPHFSHSRPLTPTLLVG